MSSVQSYGDSGGFPISLAIRAGDFVHTCAVGDHGFNPGDVRYSSKGVVIDDGAGMPKRSIEDETRGTIETLRGVLAEAGCTLADIVDISLWFKDPRDFEAVNAVYAEYFTAPYPTRSVFQVGFMGDYRIEMKATAYKPLARR
jgi:enamine deaminase RidA (YjgF/YER057c/UK114 family)